MAKQIIHGEDSRQAMLRGVNALKFGSPLVTKDGVTVAKEIDVRDPLEKMGAQMLEVASRTGDVSGDGTTTGSGRGNAVGLRSRKIAGTAGKAVGGVAVIHVGASTERK